MSEFNEQNVLIQEFEQNLKGAIFVSLNNVLVFFENFHIEVTAEANNAFNISYILFSALAVGFIALTTAVYFANKSILAQAFLLLQIPGLHCRIQHRIAISFINEMNV